MNIDLTPRDCDHLLAALEGTMEDLVAHSNMLREINLPYEGVQRAIDRFKAIYAKIANAPLNQATITPIDWLLGGDTGQSSKTILAVMTDSSIRNPDVPYDASDFGRCQRLLGLFPEWRARLHEVAERFPIWGPIVREWNDLVTLYAKGHNRTVYERLQPLIDEGRLAAGWVRTGPRSWKYPE